MYTVTLSSGDELLQMQLGSRFSFVQVYLGINSLKLELQLNSSCNTRRICSIAIENKFMIFYLFITC